MCPVIFDEPLRTVGRQNRTGNEDVCVMVRVHRVIINNYSRQGGDGGEMMLHCERTYTLL